MLGAATARRAEEDSLGSAQQLALALSDGRGAAEAARVNEQRLRELELTARARADCADP